MDLQAAAHLNDRLHNLIKSIIFFKYTLSQPNYTFKTFNKSYRTMKRYNVPMNEIPTSHYS